MLRVEDDPVVIAQTLAEEGISSVVESGSVHEVRGVVGSKGLTRGKVSIVHGVGEIGKVGEGDILCTVTTNPDYLPAMQKAAAFITDEGGITCHAAIVAREMKKPCIVGTKVATQVLKDGDLVEVDAEKGVVKVIERA